MKKTFLFLCPHHAAKSVLAEAYFNRAMAGTDYEAVSAGTEPEDAVMPSVAALLKSEEIDVSGHRPRRVTEAELHAAFRIISMGCTAEELNLAPERIESWLDIPPASQDVISASEAILTHIEQLKHELEIKMNNRIALLWYGETQADNPIIGSRNRLEALHHALADRGCDVLSIPYTHNRHDDAIEQLQDCDGVMTWMNPIEAGQDRSRLDACLGELVDKGVYVSARPDIIRKMGTKAVLYHTRHLEWGTDTCLYETYEHFAEDFPKRLLEKRTRVLKQDRGHSGEGVWKVELVHNGDTIRLMHAESDAVTNVPLSTFMSSWQEHFSAGSYLVEQPYLPRVAEGMIRCYMNQNRVIGFLHQLPKANGINVSQSGLIVTEGLPEGKRVYNADAPRYASLKAKLESGWVSEMCNQLAIDPDALPVLWDIDFIMGDHTYLLCEINVSSVYPPAEAPIEQLAATLLTLMGS
jgi:protein-tyrosine-phosphatase